MTTEPNDHDPQATIWRAVGDLESKAFTRKEIHDVLKQVADALRPEGGFRR